MATAALTPAAMGNIRRFWPSTAISSAVLSPVTVLPVSGSAWTGGRPAWVTSSLRSWGPLLPGDGMSELMGPTSVRFGSFSLTRLSHWVAGRAATMVSTEPGVMFFSSAGMFSASLAKLETLPVPADGPSMATSWSCSSAPVDSRSPGSFLSSDWTMRSTPWGMSGLSSRGLLAGAG